jgi:hypothetical protein
MTFVLKKGSDHGTSNPIVARQAVQTSEVIRFFSLPKQKQDRVLEIYINMIKPWLLQCKEISENIAKENEEIRTRINENRIQIQSSGRVAEVPQISRLTEQVETYLYNAKSSLRDLALIFEPLFGVRFDHSRYHEIKDWFEGKFGADTPVTELLAADGPWLKRIVDMRNAVEHPEGKRGPLQIQNSELIGQNSERRLFQEPVWFLKGEPPVGILPDMRIILDNFLTFAEDVLIAAYVQLHPGSIVQFVEIPEQDRNTQCPVRLRAILDQSKVQLRHPTAAAERRG